MPPKEVAKVKKFIDTFFSNQWCRDNYIVPLSEENGYLKKWPPIGGLIV